MCVLKQKNIRTDTVREVHIIKISCCKRKIK